MIEINLLPGAVRKARRGSGGINIRAAFSGLGAFANQFIIIGVALIAAGLLAVGGMYWYQGKQMDAITERGAVASRDSARYGAITKARNRAESVRDSVYRQLAIIKSIDDTRFTWPHLLEEIDVALPQYTWLTAIAQTSAVTTTAANDTGPAKAPGQAHPDTAKRAKAHESKAEQQRKRAQADSLYNGAGNTVKFRIVGQTVDIQALTQFMKNLESSPFIKNVQLTRSDLVTVDNHQVTEFQLEAETESPPHDMLQTVPLSVAVR